MSIQWGIGDLLAVTKLVSTSLLIIRGLALIETHRLGICITIVSLPRGKPLMTFDS